MNSRLTLILAVAVLLAVAAGAGTILGSGSGLEAGMLLLLVSPAALWGASKAATAPGVADKGS